METVALGMAVPNQRPLDGRNTAGRFKDGTWIYFKFIEPCERAHLVGPLVQKFPLDIGGEGHRVVNIHFVIGNHFLTLILLCLSSGIDNCRRVTAPARVGN
jgi:hypothetical protein